MSSMNQNGFEHYLNYWIANIESIIGILFVLILGALSLGLLLDLRSKKSSSDSGAGIDKEQLEESLKKVLAAVELKTSSSAIPSIQSLNELGINIELEKVPEEMRSDVSTLMQQLSLKLEELRKLKADIENLQNSIGNTANASPEQLQELNNLKMKLGDLEAKLAEYEIIEDDIANLSLYKEENTKLKAEIAELKKNPGVAATSSAPASATPTPEPVAPVATVAEAATESTDLTVDDDILSQFAAAVEEQKSQTAAAKAEEPAPQAAPAADVAEEDDLMAEFAKAVSEQKNKSLDNEPVLAAATESAPVEELNDAKIEEPAVAKIAPPAVEAIAEEAADDGGFDLMAEFVATKEDLEKEEEAKALLLKRDEMEKHATDEAKALAAQLLQKQNATETASLSSAEPIEVKKVEEKLTDKAAPSQNIAAVLESMDAASKQEQPEQDDVDLQSLVTPLAKELGGHVPENNDDFISANEQDEIMQQLNQAVQEQKAARVEKDKIIDEKIKDMRSKDDGIVHETVNQKVMDDFKKAVLNTENLEPVSSADNILNKNTDTEKLLTESVDLASVEAGGAVVMDDVLSIDVGDKLISEFENISKES